MLSRLIVRTVLIFINALGFFVLICQPTSAQTANAQAVKHVLQDFHTCGLSSQPSVFKAPSGTISYYDFILQLPSVYQECSNCCFCTRWFHSY